MNARAYDVVVIGSGAGGGTVAEGLGPLARAGYRILVVEQGPRLRDDEFTGKEADMADALYEDGGGFLTADGAMTLAFGRAWGGSTVVYTGTSLIAPKRVIDGWRVPGLAHADVERRSRKFMDENGVHLLEPDLLNENNRLFVEGCTKAGFKAEQFPPHLRGRNGPRPRGHAGAGAEAGCGTVPRPGRDGRLPSPRDPPPRTPPVVWRGARRGHACHQAPRAAHPNRDPSGQV